MITASIRALSFENDRLAIFEPHREHTTVGYSNFLLIFFSKEKKSINAFYNQL